MDPKELNEVLYELRADGFSPIDSIRVTRAVLHVSVGEAKDIVHRSQAWADLRSNFEVLQEAAEAAAIHL